MMTNFLGNEFQLRDFERFGKQGITVCFNVIMQSAQMELYERTSLSGQTGVAYVHNQIPQKLRRSTCAQRDREIGKLHGVGRNIQLPLLCVEEGLGAR
jgi:hypothetical protein